MEDPIDIKKDLAVNPYIIATNAIIKRKRFVYLVALILLVLGIVYASLVQKEYTADSTILPQVGAANKVNKYSRFAALAGLNLGGEEGHKLTASLYKVFLENLYFQRDIMEKHVKTSKLKDSISYGDYILNHYDEGALAAIKKNTFGLPGKAISLFKSKPKNTEFVVDSTINKTTAKERKQIAVLRKQLFITYDSTNGVITIEAITFDPVLSEQLVKICEEVLQKTIIDLSIEKSQIELDFLEERLIIAKADYNNKRSALGNYRDRNKYALTSYTKNIEEQLRSEYQLATSIYTQIAAQIETAKLQIAKDTPIFTSIKPPVVPSVSSSLSSGIVVFGFVFFGFLLGSLIVLYKVFKPMLMDVLDVEVKAEKLTSKFEIEEKE